VLKELMLPHIIVVGGGGAGKSWIANQLAGTEARFKESAKTNVDGTLTVEVCKAFDCTLYDTPGLNSKEAGNWISDLHCKLRSSNVSEVVVVLAMDARAMRTTNWMSDLRELCPHLFERPIRFVVVWNWVDQVPEVKRDELNEDLSRLTTEPSLHMVASSLWYVA
jgi:GTPase Era involved in 16S rRNA processing